MKRPIVIAGAAAVSIALGGCEAVPYGNYPTFRGMSGVEGEWIGTDRVAVSEFNRGSFTSHATDTGNLLAQGNYRYVDDRDIEVTFTSLIRKQTIQANCALVAPDQMNCTSSSGAKFQLMRHRPV